MNNAFELNDTELTEVSGGISCEISKCLSREFLNPMNHL
jgi:bacteriocin-like protein